jgi:hypothetical protein
MSSWFSGLEIRFVALAVRKSLPDSASLALLFPAKYRAVFVFARAGYCRAANSVLRLMPLLTRSLPLGTSAPPSYSNSRRKRFLSAL